MNRYLSLLLLALVMCLGATAQVKKTNLKVLYVGGHSNIETFGVDAYDTAANDRSIVERTAAWEKYLNEYFTTVKTVKGNDYNYKMSYDYDVTIIDGNPKPLEPRRYITVNGNIARIIDAATSQTISTAQLSPLPKQARL